MRYKTLAVPLSLHQRLKAVAFENGQSLTFLAKKIIKMALEYHKEHHIKEIDLYAKGLCLSKKAIIHIDFESYKNLDELFYARKNKYYTVMSRGEIFSKFAIDFLE